jgi:hypothetical protein
MRLRNLSVGLAILSLAAAPVFAAGPKTTNGPKGAPKGPSTTSTTSQAPKTHGNPHTTQTATSTSTPAAPTTTTTTPTLNPIAQKIASKPNLLNKVQTMLPSGMTLNQASKGFKNQGQFIAALHVSQNLNIPFAQLRTQMVGENKSLGQAIQALRGTTDAERAASKAQRQANADLSDQ